MHRNLKHHLKFTIMKAKVTHREAYFISCISLGKVSHQIETQILGPFYDYLEARRNLLDLHARRINYFNEDIKSTFLGDSGNFSNIETDVLIFQLELFSKTIFL